MGRYEWYGVVFALEERASKVLKEIDTSKEDSGLDILRAQILIDLSGALRAGLERRIKYETRD